MGFYENNNELVHEIERLKKENNFLEERNRHLSKCYSKVHDFILGNNYYNMGMDSWTCEEEIASDCVSILNTPLINFILDRRLKKQFCFDRELKK